MTTVADIQAKMAALIASAKAEHDSDVALRTFLSGVQAQLTDISGQLKTALAANAPQDGELKSISDQLDTVVSGLDADTAANAIADQSGGQGGDSGGQPASPSVTSIDPTSGNTGTVVTVTGVGLTGATAVNFGGVAGTALDVMSDTEIQVDAPAGGSGSVQVIAADGSVIPGTASFSNTDA